MAAYKETANLKVLAVTGCMAQRYKDEIIAEIPEADIVLGTTTYDKIVEAIEEVLNEKGIKEVLVDTATKPEHINDKRILTTGGHFAYLKIAEGCDKHCTYCIIPSLRGNYRSVPMEELVAEATKLANEGVKELILVAQETTLYGVDLYGEKSLHRLLRALCKIEALEWIRILYCYPEEIYEELIEVIADEEKICNYLDMPIQHASDSILKRMARRTNQNELIEIITKLRNKIPDIALRTTLITGFPSETEEDIDELIAFVSDMKFDRLGVFTYSPQEGTPAADMPNQIEEDVKNERYADIMEVQQEIAFEASENMIGKELKVMIEGQIPEGDEEDADMNLYVGRTYKDAPGVDGLIFVRSYENLMSGDFVKAVVVGAEEYDLIGNHVVI
jgi:ribosomal protein S12 methylthiotransferase